jgi:hypothetical protein
MPMAPGARLVDVIGLMSGGDVQRSADAAMG